MPEHRDHSNKPRRPTPVSVAAVAPAQEDGGPAVEMVTEEATGVHSGEALREIRAMRPTDMRLERLEDKHDALSEAVGKMIGEVGEMRGELRVLPKLIEELSATARATQAREHVTFTAQVDVDTAKKVAHIHDKVDVKKQRRLRITKIVTGAVSIFSSGVVLHWLLGKLGYAASGMGGHSYVHPQSPHHDAVAQREHDRVALRAARVLLEGLVGVNVFHIARSWKRVAAGIDLTPFPPLFSTGIFYQEDPPGEENWRDAPAALEQFLRTGRGIDCDQLVAWRSGELRVAGIHADPVIKWQHFDKPTAVALGYPAENIPEDGLWLVHCLVRYPVGYEPTPGSWLADRLEWHPDDGCWIEDTSKILGMNGGYNDRA